MSDNDWMAFLERQNRKLFWEAVWFYALVAFGVAVVVTWALVYRT